MQHINSRITPNVNRFDMAKFQIATIILFVHKEFACNRHKSVLG